MAQVLQPLQILIAVLAGWINEHQQTAIDYLREENRVLKEQLGGKRLRLTDDQRRRLAAKGKALGRRALKEIASIVTPDTHTSLASPADSTEVDPQASFSGTPSDHLEPVPEGPLAGVPDSSE